MLQSYSYNDHAILSKGDTRYSYYIIDTDFSANVDVIVAMSTVREREHFYGYSRPACTAIAKLYEERKLNVAVNLVRCIQMLVKERNYTLDRIIEFNRVMNPYWKKYELDVMKYMMLL